MHVSSTALRAIGLAAVALPATTLAASDIVLFDDRDDFISWTTGTIVTEDFEDDPIANVDRGHVFTNSGLIVSVDDVSWETSVTDFETFSYNTTDGGSQHLRFAFGLGSYTASFMSDDMKAFGFDITGFQDLTDLGGFDLALYDDDVLVGSIFVSDPGTYFAQFHGVVSDVKFDRVDIAIAGVDFVGFDDIQFEIFGVPTPGVAALLALAAIAGRRRRRRD